MLAVFVSPWSAHEAIVIEAMAAVQSGVDAGQFPACALPERVDVLVELPRTIVGKLDDERVCVVCCLAVLCGVDQNLPPRFRQKRKAKHSSDLKGEVEGGGLLRGVHPLLREKDRVLERPQGPQGLRSGYRGGGG